MGDAEVVDRLSEYCGGVLIEVRHSAPTAIPTIGELKDDVVGNETCTPLSEPFLEWQQVVDVSI